MSGYKLPHGYAVAIGICIDLGYAVETGLMKPGDRDAVLEILQACGALDGLAHSGHLLSQADNLLFGLDAWLLSAVDRKVAVPAGIGKVQAVGEVDREAFRAVVKKVVSSSATA